MATTRPVRAQSGVPEKKVRVSRVPSKKVAALKKPVTKSAVVQREKASRTPRKRTTHIAVSEDKSRAVAVPIHATRSTSLAFPKIVSIAQLSAFRFPIDQQQLLVQTSRVSGLVVVVVGALLTVFNMFGLGSVVPTSGALLTSALVSGTSTYNCADVLSQNYDKEYCEKRVTQTSGADIPSVGDASEIIKTTPEVSFTIDGAASLRGVVPVHMTVQGATLVQVYVRNKSTGVVYPLGAASKVSDTVWRVDWKTSAYPDGSYVVKASVTNSYKTYNASASGEFTVLNTEMGNDAMQSEPVGDRSSTSSTGVAYDESSTSKVLEISDTGVSEGILFELEASEPLTGTARITVTASDVLDVKLYVQNAESLQKSFLGYAVYSGDKLWKHYWNTRTSQNGSYSVFASVRLKSGETVTKILRDVTVQNEEKTTTDAPVSIAATSTVKVSDSLEKLEAGIQIHIPEASDFSNAKNVLFTVSDAQFIEVYAVPKGSLIRKFLGLARKLSDTDWILTVDTRNMPNGTYDIFGEVRFMYGDVQSKRVEVTVEGDVPRLYTEDQTTYIKSLESLTDEIEADLPAIKPIVLTPRVSEDVQDTGSDVQIAEGEVSLSADADRALTPISIPRSDTEAALVLTNFEDTLRDLMQEYAEALRVGDTQRVEELRAQIVIVRKKLTEDIESQGYSREEIDAVHAQVDDVVKVSEARVIRQEKVLKERIGAAVFSDKDADGISDYDEIKLYRTDPYVADTDGDGFTDASEVLSGFNPTDSVRESLMVYESPKQAGTVRSDVLTVNMVSTIDETPEIATVLKPRALMSGTGLPNSFITLYIFSTPIIVTVKTDADGSWSYVFDKELEDGNHEVYVGMTDNAGRVIAKSEAFSFVKTAEAFSPVSTGTESTVVATAAEPSFVTQQALLIIASIAVVALGLILILLGMHVELWYKRKLVPQ